MSKSNRTQQARIGLPAIFGIVFVVLKLCGVIAWSWWWVLAPFWIPFGLWILILIVGAAVIFANRPSRVFSKPTRRTRTTKEMK